MSTPHEPTRWKVNTALLAAGAATVFSGLLVQIRFHLQRPGTPLWGLDQGGWNMVHQVAAFSFLGAAVWHIALNWQAFLQGLAPRRSWRRLGFYLSILFGLAAATGLMAWGAFLVFDHGDAENTLVEIHDKATLPLSVLLVVHAWQRRGRLFRRG